MQNEETLIVSNTLGIVTSKRVSLHYKSGSRDIPVNQISSVGFERKRNYFWVIGGVVLLAIGIVGIISTNHLGGSELMVLSVVALLGLLIFIAHVIGHYNLVVSSSRAQLKPLRVEMSKTDEGKELFIAIHKVVFS